MNDEQPLLIISGSRRNPSRTRELSIYAREYIKQAGYPAELLDLRDYPLELFDGKPLEKCTEPTQYALHRLLSTQVYVFVSPVYYGMVSGALKTLIDHIPYEEFQKVPRTAGIMMTGRDNRHQLLLDAQLRTTLLYLGVTVATTGVFVTEDDFTDYTLSNPRTIHRLETMIDELTELVSR